MSLGEFDGSAFHDQEAVLEVFYKKTHKEQCSKNLWLTLHAILTDSLPDPASWSLQIAGPNKVRRAPLAPHAHPPRPALRVRGFHSRHRTPGEHPR